MRHPIQLNVVIRQRKFRLCTIVKRHWHPREQIRLLRIPLVSCSPIGAESCGRYFFPAEARGSSGGQRYTPLRGGLQAAELEAHRVEAFGQDELAQLNLLESWKVGGVTCDISADGRVGQWVQLDIGVCLLVLVPAGTKALTAASVGYPVKVGQIPYWRDLEVREGHG